MEDARQAGAGGAFDWAIRPRAGAVTTWGGPLDRAVAIGRPVGTPLAPRGWDRR